MKTLRSRAEADIAAIISSAGNARGKAVAAELAAADLTDQQRAEALADGGGNRWSALLDPVEREAAVGAAPPAHLDLALVGRERPVLGGVDRKLVQGQRHGGRGAARARS